MKISLSTFSTLMFFACLAIIGFFCLPFLQLQIYPTDTRSTFKLNYYWPDASSKVIEQEVTSKFESFIGGLEGVMDISSLSKKGVGQISIELKEGADRDYFRLEVANIVRRIYPELPSGVSYPEIIDDGIGDNKFPILTYSINTVNDYNVLKRMLDNKIIPDISGIDGINNVEVYGITNYEVVIKYDIRKLLSNNISVEELSEAIGSHLRSQALGNVEVKDNNSILHQVSVRIEAAKEAIDWETLPVKKVGETLVTLSQLASVERRESDADSYYRVNGMNTLTIAIYPGTTTNILRLSTTVKDAILAMADNLGPGYNIKLMQDRSEYFKKEIDKVFSRVVFSLTILLIFTLLFYRDARYFIVLFVGLISSLLASAILYYLLGIEIHTFAFAGITVSFGLIMNNILVITECTLNDTDRSIFRALVGSNLTAIGATAIIFFINDELLLSLHNFAVVLIINLLVSVINAIVLVPALIAKLKIKRKPPGLKKVRLNRRIFSWYGTFLILIQRKRSKYALITFLILLFGLPLEIMPKRINSNEPWARFYNEAFGTYRFENDIKPILEKVLGGSINGFIKNTNLTDSKYDKERTVLTVRGAMPDGCTAAQLNAAIKKIERYISTFRGIDFFETQIVSYKDSRITIYFKKEHESSNFPLKLKSFLESQVLLLGGVEWSISGVGMGFSNALNSSRKSDNILIEGYNYDELYGYAGELADKIESAAQGRAQAVVISSGEKDNNVLDEYFLEFSPELMELHGVGQSDYYRTLKGYLHSDKLQSYVAGNELKDLVLLSSTSQDFNIWDLKNTPLAIGSKEKKLDQISDVTKKQSGNTIYRHNQQYSLSVDYNFIGEMKQAEAFKKDVTAKFAPRLPLGYKIVNDRNEFWNSEKVGQYLSVGIVILVIFFICAIMLESISQPLAVISMIPISFIGVFITFRMMNLKFDQGGYVCFILLSGITVNSSLYIVSEFNRQKLRYTRISRMSAYIRAIRKRLRLVMLMIICTIVSLVPFLIDGREEGFWFSFSMGTIGGVVFSVLGILVYLPLFLKLKGKD